MTRSSPAGAKTMTRYDTDHDHSWERSGLCRMFLSFLTPSYTPLRYRIIAGRNTWTDTGCAASSTCTMVSVLNWPRLLLAVTRTT